MGGKTPTESVERDGSSPHRQLGAGRCCYLLGALPLLLAVLLYNLPLLIDEWEGLYGYGTAPTYGLPPRVGELFKLYDTNADGVIDPIEFVQLSAQFKDQANYSYVEFDFVDTEGGPGAEMLLVRAEYVGIDMDSMTKFKDKEYLLGSPEQILPGLVKWREAHRPLTLVGARNFRAFLPPMEDWPFGQAYLIIEPVHDTIMLHMNRYHPAPPSSKKETLLHAILSQLHPNIFLQNRFGPRGAVAVVRAYNEDYLDIVIRVHAEFQLNEAPDYPFWLTPAQFAGRLVISRDAQHVHHFELALPTHKQLNIDMEWLIGDDSNEVDIGYVPRMTVFAPLPSVPWQEDVEDMELDMSSEVPYNFSQLSWDREMPLVEAQQILEKKMYPFKRVEYLPYLQAIEEARAGGKLVHHVLLWGALDDQSC